MQMIRVWLIVLMIVSFASANKHMLTLDEVISLAIRHSPDLKSYKLDVQKASTHTKYIYGNYLPHLSLSANGGKGLSKLKHQPYGNIDILQASIHISQLVYDFGKNSHLLDASIQMAQAYKAQFAQKLSDKLFQVKQAYFELLKAKGIIEVEKKHSSLQQKQLYRAKKYLKAGIKTIIDVSDAKVRLSQAKKALNSARYLLELQKSNLEQIIGVSPYSGIYDIYTPTLDANKLSKKLPKIPKDIHRLQRYAYKHRAIIKSSEHIIKSTQSTLHSIKSDYYPNLSLSGNYMEQKVDSHMLATMPKSQGDVTLNLNWNLFEGYQTDTKIQEAKIDTLKANANKIEIKNYIKAEVTQAYLKLKESIDTFKLNKEILKVSKEKFYQARKRYENDLSDFIELQNARLDYINSLNSLINSFYDCYIAQALLNHAIGE